MQRCIGELREDGPEQLGRKETVEHSMREWFGVGIVVGRRFEPFTNGDLVNQHGIILRVQRAQ